MPTPPVTAPQAVEHTFFLWFYDYEWAALGSLATILAALVALALPFIMDRISRRRERQGVRAIVRVVRDDCHYLARLNRYDFDGEWDMKVLERRSVEILSALPAAAKALADPQLPLRLHKSGATAAMLSLQTALERLMPRVDAAAAHAADWLDRMGEDHIETGIEPKHVAHVIAAADRLLETL